MKKTLAGLILSIFVVLTTASFGFAEYAATGSSNFPYFRLGCLVIGGMIIISLKQKYDKIYLSEAVGSFALLHGAGGHVHLSGGQYDKSHGGLISGKRGCPPPAGGRAA